MDVVLNGSFLRVGPDLIINLRHLDYILPKKDDSDATKYSVKFVLHGGQSCWTGDTLTMNEAADIIKRIHAAIPNMLTEF